MTPQLPDKSVSYWIDSTSTTHFPPLNRKVEVDIAIIGGGIAGLTAALLLQKSGAKVAVLEATRIVRGATGYTTAKITSQHRIIYQKIVSQFGEEAAQAYGEANQAGLELIATWVKEKNIDCDFRRKSAYVYTLSKDELSLLEAECKAAQKARLPASLTASTTLPFDIAGAICFTEQAEFHPRKYLLALANQITEHSGLIFEESRVIEVKDGTPCEAHTTQGKITAREIIIATHFPISDHAFYFARMASKTSYALGVQIEGNTPDGMFIGTRHEWPSLRSHPTPNGEMLIVVGEGHKTGQGGDILARYHRLEKFSEKNFKVKSIPYRWCTQDNMPHDGIPFIGKFSPFSKHLYVATGFQAWGMANGTAAAMILTDLILGKKNPWAFLFNPNRIKTFFTKKMFTENVNSVSGMIRNRFLKRGKHHAVYQDKQGATHTLSSICPHMGCIVQWNNAEESWDCPCHGSRFDCDGTLLHGPATHGLKKSKVEIHSIKSKVH